MPPLLGTIHRTVRAVAAGLLAVVVGGAAVAGCSKSDPQFEELHGWERVEVLPHADVIPYDRVATTAGPNGVAWLTWASRRDDALAYHEVGEGDEVRETVLAAPGVPVLIPIGVATDGEGWVAVAATRDRANGENTGLMAWQPRPSSTPGSAGSGSESASGSSGSSSPGSASGSAGASAPTPVAAAPRGQMLAPPRRGLPQPEAVNAGRASGTNLVAGVADGEVVAWRSTDDGRRWQGSVLDLGVDADLTAIDLVGHGSALVLAGVDADGGAHLWTSPDGLTWNPAPTDDLPTGVRSVTLLASLDQNELALAWLAGGEGDDSSSARTGSTATVQRFDGRRVTDEGTIEARPEAGIPTFSLDGATLSPEGRLVVVGTAAPEARTGVPMIWLRDGDTWEPSPQRELAGRVDYQFRAITTTPNGEMVGLVTPATHVDLEVWRWSPGS
jgi:hypothetical protein